MRTRNSSFTILFASILGTIAISVNGQVVSTPVVKMKLDDGSCSVMLDDTQVTTFFPNVNIKELKNTAN